MLLDPEEQDRLIQGAREVSSSVGAYVFALLRTGFRGATLRALEWSDVDWKRREWAVPAKKMKSRQAFRAPIQAELFEYLREHARPSGKIFRKLKTERWREALDKAELPANLKQHDTRRSFLTSA